MILMFTGNTNEWYPKFDLNVKPGFTIELNKKKDKSKIIHLLGTGKFKEKLPVPKVIEPSEIIPNTFEQGEQ